MNKKTTLPQAKQLVEHIKTLPFATVIKERKKNLRKAIKESNAVPADAFFDELNSRIKKRFDHA